MLLTKKIRLKPTAKQEILFRKSAGIARWTYNYFLSENDRVWQEYLANGETGVKSVSEGAVRKYINNVLKKTTHTWLKEVGSNVMKQAVKDVVKSYQNFFKGIAEFPKFKSRKKSRPSFYIDTSKISFTSTYVKLEKLTTSKKRNRQKFNFVKLLEPDRIP